jgi:hypothetical protein
MKKISDILIQMIGDQPFLEEALQYGFLNLTAFAEYIRPYVEQESQKMVSIHAIKMALSRLDRPIEILVPLTRILPEQMSTRTGLSIITLMRSSRSVEILAECMIETRRKNSGFFTMVEGISEIDIILDMQISDLVATRISPSLPILIVHDLGLISFHLSESEISIP